MILTLVVLSMFVTLMILAVVTMIHLTFEKEFWFDNFKELLRVYIGITLSLMVLILGLYAIGYLLKV
ncbi:MAG: hypothetical protein ACRDA4_08075 [Filifactoraceae bacterium]